MTEWTYHRHYQAMTKAIVSGVMAVALLAGVQALAADGGSRVTTPGTSSAGRESGDGASGGQPSRPAAPNRERMPERNELAPGEIPQGPGCPYYEGDDLQLLV